MNAMARMLTIHPINPQARAIQQAADIIKKGGVVIYPTDSAYAMGCQLSNKEGLERIRVIRQLDETHHFTLICRDLSQVSNYAVIDDASFRAIKKHTPGPFTFILAAKKTVPRRLLHAKRLTIGVRVSDNLIVQALLAEMAEPLMSVTLLLPEHQYPVSEPSDFDDLLGNRVDMIIAGGVVGLMPTTVVDLTGESPKILRQGRGEF
jgi:tRNA threonylcarbamoyl adenosine modification protein (Sua5/YciO/YrdC/YwlC family)